MVLVSNLWRREKERETPAGAVCSLTQVNSFGSRWQSALLLVLGNREAATQARSRIVDADTAAESANLALKSILQQSGAAVLAQANSQPQLALQLLRN